MPQVVIKDVHDCAKRLAREEQRHKMVFLEKNKERYDWNNSDLDDNKVPKEVNPSSLNRLPDELPGIDTETGNIDTSAVKPEITQSDAECIHKATTNSIFIPEVNNIRYVG